MEKQICKPEVHYNKSFITDGVEFSFLQWERLYSYYGGLLPAGVKLVLNIKLRAASGVCAEIRLDPSPSDLRMLADMFVEAAHSLEARTRQIGGVA